MSPRAAAPSWDALKSTHTSETSTTVKRIFDEAKERAVGEGPPHQDNKLRLFGSSESDVRVTFYRDHAAVRMATLTRVRERKARIETSGLTRT